MKRSFFYLAGILAASAVLAFTHAGNSQAEQGIVNGGPSLRFTGTVVLTDATGPVMGILSPARAYNQLVWSGGSSDSIGFCQQENTNTLANPDDITLELGDFRLAHFNLINGGNGDHRIYAGGRGRVKSGQNILLASENFSISMNLNYLNNTITGHGIAPLDPAHPSALRDELDNGSGQVEFVFNSLSPVVQGLFGIYNFDITIRPAAIQQNIVVQPVIQHGIIPFPGTHVSLDIRNFLPGGESGNLNNILINRIMDEPGGNPPQGSLNISPHFYWEFGSVLSSFNADLVFDLSGSPGIQFIENLRILKRDPISTAWEEYSRQTVVDSTHLRADGVTQTGQWAVGIVDLVKGDINGDGLVNLADAILAKRILINDVNNVVPYLNADINRDNKLGLAEAVFILQAVAGLRENLINHSPIISGQTFSIGDSSLSGTIVGRVSANDPDSADILTYTIAGGNTNNLLAINSANGDLSIDNTKELFYQNAASYTLQINVSDGFKTSSGNIVINVTQEDSAKNVFSYTAAITGEELTVRVIFSQILPSGVDPQQLKPRILEIHPQWNNSYLEYLEATIGQAAVDAQKDLALAATQTIEETPEWSEGRFLIMSAGNTNRVGPGELMILRFRILKPGFTNLKWNHDWTATAPQESNDILKLMGTEVSLP